MNPWPTPYQKPHPPVWVPSQGSADTIRWAAQKRYTYCQTLAPIKTVAEFFDMYREEARKAGYEATNDQLAWSNTIYVAETDAKARRTRKYAYLCMVSEGDRSPPVAAAVKKEPPSATHGSLVVIEHGRTRKTAVRCRDPAALETRTPSH